MDGAGDGKDGAWRLLQLVIVVGGGSKVNKSSKEIPSRPTTTPEGNDLRAPTDTEY